MDAWASGAAAAPPELWGPLIKSAGMFCVVLALLLMGLYVIKRFWVEGRRAGQQGIIRSVAAYSVAPKSRLIVVNIRGEHLLLGVTPQQINFLTKLDPQEEVAGDSGGPPPENQAGFGKLLHKAMHPGRKP